MEIKRVARFTEEEKSFLSSSGKILRSVENAFLSKETDDMIAEDKALLRALLEVTNSVLNFFEEPNVEE